MKCTYEYISGWWGRKDESTLIKYFYFLCDCFFFHFFTIIIMATSSPSPSSSPPVHVAAASGRGVASGSALEKAELREWVKRRHVPTVFVAGTDAAEAIAARSGLSLRDLLSPFGVIENISVPIRTVAHSYSLRGFRLRFVDIAEARPVPVTIAEDYLKKVLSQNPPADDSSVSSSPALSPWYKQYRDAIHLTLRNSEHELIDAPVAMILIASSADEISLNSLFDRLLSETYETVGGFRTRLFDRSQVPVVRVLLHDNTTMPYGAIAASELQGRIRQTGKPCTLVRINSLGPTDRNANAPDMWSPYLNEKFFTRRIPQTEEIPCLGCRLSPEDLMCLQNFVKNLALNVCIRDMERRMFALNDKVTEKRKGMKNILKSWWRKPKTPPPSQRMRGTGGSNGPLSPGGSSIVSVAYTGDSIEGQIRALADLAFIVQDYDMALSNYRLVRDDFKSDKAHRHLGSVLEMMALCLFMSEGSKRQIMSYLKDANEAFSRAAAGERKAMLPTAPDGLARSCRFATKSTFLLSEILLSAGSDLHTASAALLRASTSESSLTAAVLLEQAGKCMLRSGTFPGKHGFHMVMAGSLYGKCGQERHAVHCYKAAKSEYGDEGWAYIQDHLSMTLGRWVYKLGYAEECAESWGNVLQRGHQSVAKQTVLLRDFTTVVKAKKDDKKEWDVAIPRVDSVSTVARLQSNGLMVTPAKSLKDFKRMMKRCERHCAEKNARPITGNKVPVDEPVLVDIVLENPLGIALHVKDVRLVATIDGKELPDEEVPKVDILLQPSEKKVAVLQIAPRTLGTLEIVGVRWRLLDLVNVFKRFEFPGKPLNKTREQRATRARARDTRMIWTVVDRAPLLSLSIEMPKEAYNGQIFDGVVRVKNVGKAACSSGLTLTYAGRFSVHVDSAATLDEAGRVLQITSSSESPFLEPGEERSIACSIRARGESGPGTEMLLGVRYAGKDGRFRYAFLSSAVNFFPSIDLSVATRPAYAVEGAYTMMIRVDAPDVGGTHWNLGPIGVTSDYWEAVAFGNPPQAFGPLNPGSTFVYVYTLRPKAVPQIPASSDVFMCLEHAPFVLQDREAKRVAEAKERERLEAAGKLPISIQDIRRAARSGQNSPAITQVHHKACAHESLLSGPDTELHVAVPWSSSDGHTGVLYHMRVEVRPLRNAKVCPIMMSLDYPRVVTHSFCAGDSGGAMCSLEGGCIVPIRVCLQNQAKEGENPVTFRLEAESPAKYAPVAVRGRGTPLDNGIPGSVFSWSGSVETIVRNVKPGEVRTVCCNAVFNKPGTYDLNYFALFFEADELGIEAVQGASTLRFVFPSEYRITVRNKDANVLTDVAL